MASAATLELTEAHRLAQGAIGIETIEMMIHVWVQADGVMTPGSVATWLRQAERVVASQNARSAALAEQYVKLHQRLELGPNASGADLVDLRSPITELEMRPSLLVTGPGKFKEALSRGASPEQAGELARVASARSAQRLTLNGGRSVVLRTGVGYRRVTSGSPCAFCAMLSARGAVYHSSESAGFEAHDGCNCHPEAVYRKGDGSSKQNQEWKDVYDAAQGERAAGEIQAGGKNPQLNALRTYMRHNGLLV